MRWMIAILMLLCSLAPGSAQARPARQRVTGQPPPAQAPFAEDDPIAALRLKPHVQQESPRQAVESFLYYLSIGYDPAVLEHAGGSLGDAQGYHKAWLLLAEPRPAEAAFVQQWRGTAAMKVLQIELMDRPERFFVELQRVDWCGDRWATSFFWGEVLAVKIAEGWRVSKVTLRPENLVYSNVGGHQGWQHSADFMAVWYARLVPPGKPEPWKESWELVSLSYQRGSVTAVVRQPQTKERRTVRMARVMEGSWALLSMEPSPGPLPPSPIP